MPAPRYDANGNLQIWTGTGWETIPKIAASDLSYYDPTKDVSANGAYTIRRNPTTGDYEKFYANMGDGPARTEVVNPGYSFVGDASKYGNLANMNNFSTNWLIENATPDSFNLTVKSGDKAGSQIKYTLKDGQWVPEFMGDIAWDTNADSNGASIRNIARVLAAPAMVYGGQELGLIGQGVNFIPGTAEALAAGLGEAGIAGAYGVGSGVAGAAAGAATGAASNPYGLESAFDGSAGNVSGFAGSGQSGVTAFGQPFSTGATLSAAGEAGGSILGLPNLAGVPGAVAGGAWAGLPSEIGSSSLGWGDNMLAPPGPGGPAPTTTPNPPPTDPSKIPEWLKTAAPYLKYLAPVVGGLLAKSTTGEDNSSSGPTATGGPVTTPTMYGSGSGSGLLGGQNWGAMGPTETERRMRMQYLPGLLGSGPWSV